MNATWAVLQSYVVWTLCHSWDLTKVLVRCNSEIFHMGHKSFASTRWNKDYGKYPLQQKWFQKQNMSMCTASHTFQACLFKLKRLDVLPALPLGATFVRCRWTNNILSKSRCITSLPCSWLKGTGRWIFTAKIFTFRRSVLRHSLALPQQVPQREQTQETIPRPKIKIATRRPLKRIITAYKK